MTPSPFIRACEINLRDVVAARKLDQGASRVVTSKDAGLNTHIACEIEMTRESIAVCFRQGTEIARGLHGNCKALRAEIVAHAPGPADRHRSLRMCGYQ